MKVDVQYSNLICDFAVMGWRNLGVSVGIDFLGGWFFFFLNVLSSYVVFFSCGCYRLIDVTFQTWEVDIG